jgi:hypothetical protein
MSYGTWFKPTKYKTNLKHYINFLKLDEKTLGVKWVPSVVIYCSGGLPNAFLCFEKNLAPTTG